MNMEFVYGMLAEKAKIANTLIAELMAGMPDDMLAKYKESLEVGSAACRGLYTDLRSPDTDREDKDT